MQHHTPSTSTGGRRTQVPMQKKSARLGEDCEMIRRKALNTNVTSQPHQLGTEGGDGRMEPPPWMLATFLCRVQG